MEPDQCLIVNKEYLPRILIAFVLRLLEFVLLSPLGDVCSSDSQSGPPWLLTYKQTDLIYVKSGVTRFTLPPIIVHLSLKKISLSC